MSHQDKNKDEDQTERLRIREELSNMSFEELQKLKEKLGAKVYNEALFDTSSKKKRPEKSSLKRENKNRPREMSSKKPVPQISNTITTTIAESTSRDPRFDSLCGSYNPQAFRRGFKFLGPIREKELKQLQEELTETEDEERRSKIKYLINRLENQNREDEKRQKLDEEKRREYVQKIQTMKEGKTPYYMKKSDKKVVNLVEKFEDLKKSGKIGKHITKHRIKNTQKARKHIKFDN